MVKAHLLFLFFLFFFIAIIAKLFYLQVLNPKSYLADYLTTRKILPERGKIYDVNHEPMASNENTYLLFVEPQKVTDKDSLVKKINDILQIGEATIEAKIDMSKSWVAIKKGINAQTKDKLSQAITQGIGFDLESKRFYPEASLSAHILGFVGKNNNGDNTGYFGIEGFYDQELAGLPGFIKSEKDLIGRPIFFGTQEHISAQNGRDLVLTVDRSVQHIVKEKLLAGLQAFQAKEGCAIFADPYTMQILSLVCLPDFDPDTYYEFSGDDYKNPAISNLYEPGSTFKPLIMAAGIEADAIKPDEVMNEDGPVSVGEYKIRTWDDKYSGKITMTNILEKSSNVGMVYIGNKLGNDRLYNSILKYGFGKPTEVDLQGEVSGYLRPKNDWYPIDFATATFGQGIAVSPIQMITAFSSIVNGGYLMKPYIVKQTIDGDITKTREPTVRRRVISEHTSAVLKKMLVSVVENGEVKWARPKGYTFGGKTGTAQIPIAGHYDPTKTIASFVGFVPADHPKFIGMVIIKEPKSSEWGSETAAPLFFDIANDLLAYYNIPPDRNE